MATIAELIERWAVRKQDYARLRVTTVDPSICDDVIADLRALAVATDDVVTLREASAMGGYDYDSLQRMVSAGSIENVGRKGAPRIRRADVPVKPGHSLRLPATGDQLSVRRQIVRQTLANTQRSA